MTQAVTSQSNAVAWKQGPGGSLLDQALTLYSYEVMRRYEISYVRSQGSPGEVGLWGIFLEVQVPWNRFQDIDLCRSGSKVRCYTEQCYMGTCNVRSVNQGKLEMVK